MQNRYKVKINKDIEVRLTPKIRAYEALLEGVVPGSEEDFGYPKRVQIHPVAVIRDGEWIGTQIGLGIEKYGQVGGEGTETPKAFGGRLKEGDVLLPLREGASINANHFRTVVDFESLEKRRFTTSRLIFLFL